MQTLHSGINCTSGLADLLNHNGRKITVVTGRHVLEEEWFQTQIDALHNNTEIIHPPEGLLQLSKIPLINKADVLVAIGGGKTIDFAKAILQKTTEPQQVFFVAVPTTAGSGSEATPFAVVYYKKEKQTIDSSLLLPAAVFLDGALLKNLSPRQRAFSGADAFSQCIESLWNIHRTETSEKFALKGLEVLFHHLNEFVASGDELSGQRILEAAHVAGKAIALTRTTGPHALSYYLTAHHDVPHGQAVALFLPLFFLFNQTKINPSIYKVLNVANANEAFTVTTEFFKNAGLARNFTDIGLTDIDIDGLLQSVNHQRFSNNPVPFNEKILSSLIHQYLL